VDWLWPCGAQWDRQRASRPYVAWLTRKQTGAAEVKVEEKVGRAKGPVFETALHHRTFGEGLGLEVRVT